MKRSLVWLLLLPVALSFSAQQPRRKFAQKKRRSDSLITDIHQSRIHNAGRIGTKRFVDPAKVFVANLSLQSTEAELEEFLTDFFGVPSYVLLKNVKIVHDWKTGNSKGYAFVDFAEPIFATRLLAERKLVLNGRTLEFKPAVNKANQEQQIYLKKRYREKLSAAEAAIEEGIKEAEGDEEEDDGLLDDEEFESLLQNKDPFTEEVAEEDEDLSHLNREQRRKVQRTRKKKKASTGFG